MLDDSLANYFAKGYTCAQLQPEVPEQTPLFSEGLKLCTCIAFCSALVFLSIHCYVFNLDIYGIYITKDTCQMCPQSTFTYLLHPLCVDKLPQVG